MALFGVGLDVEVKRITTNFKMQIAKRGGIGIRSLAVIFRQMDNNGNKKLDIEEFTQALNTYGIFAKVVEIQALMKSFDVDCDGNISYEEFIRGLRAPLTERRSNIVNMAFALMDKDGSGVINGKDVGAMLDCSQMDKQGRSDEECIAEFLNSFDGMKGNNDGQITKGEWTDYYSDLSMSMVDDDYFVKMMESAW